MTTREVVNGTAAYKVPIPYYRQLRPPFELDSLTKKASRICIPRNVSVELPNRSKTVKFEVEPGFVASVTAGPQTYIDSQNCTIHIYGQYKDGDRGK